mmetsp:Transcript_52359/g.132328  ORF Transcript_52359/g.132328 Transcript_52359/m.132328 type:complete len:207 (+) Transcript_52359:139-759(+)
MGQHRGENVHMQMLLLPLLLRPQVRPKQSIKRPQLRSLTECQTSLCSLFRLLRLLRIVQLDELAGAETRSHVLAGPSRPRRLLLQRADPPVPLVADSGRGHGGRGRDRGCRGLDRRGGGLLVACLAPADIAARCRHCCAATRRLATLTAAAAAPASNSTDGPSEGKDTEGEASEEEEASHSTLRGRCQELGDGLHPSARLRRRYAL